MGLYSNDFIITFEHFDSSSKLRLSRVLVEGGNTNYNWETIPAELSGSGTITSRYSSYTFDNIPVGKKIRLKFRPKNLYAIEFAWFNNFRSFEVEQWGTSKWISTNRMFLGFSDLKIVATDIPDFSNNLNMKAMFFGCSNLDTVYNINLWNTIRVKDMSDLFFNCHNFNQNINSWRTDSVIDFSRMFHEATLFNQPLDSWNTSQVKTFEQMFLNAHNFNGRIGAWNTENAVSFEEMFAFAYKFNQPIGEWNTKNLKITRRMFWEAHVFNQPIGEWNTENIVNMEWMFKRAYKFNQPIGKWNTSNVTNMWDMFIFNYDFNQDISNWNVENVVDMRGILFDANSFNQNLGKWKFHPSVNMYRIIGGTNLDCFNYTATLNGWAQNNPHLLDKVQDVFHLKYGNNAIEARNQLINQGWEFHGDVELGLDCGITSTKDIDVTAINIYPNPTNELLTIKGLVHDTKMDIVNVLGVNVATFEVNTTSNTLYLQNLSMGIYFLIFEQNGEVITRKFLVQR